MCSLVISKDKLLLNSSEKIVYLDTSFKSDEVKEFLPLKLSEESVNGNGCEESEGNKKNAEKKGAQTKDSVCSVCVSDCGQYLAVATDNKKLLIFHQDKLVSQVLLTRKASKLLFSSKDPRILILADKNGDVYSFDTKEEKCNEGEVVKPKLMLGHLSMLLDVCLSPDNKYILTADRDEKIRVSNFPNCYNIKTFCLGHTDFVTSISLFTDEILVSGSGDGTIRVWKYLTAEQLQMRDVSQDLQTNEDQKQVKMDTDEKSQPSDSPAAVIKVKTLQNSNYFIAQIAGLTGCVLFQYDVKENKIEKKQTIKLPNDLLDFTVGQSNDLYFLTHKDSCYHILKYDFDGSCLNRSNEIQVPASVLIYDSTNSGGGTESLQKRWFDNMKEYMERKQIRLEQTKNKNAFKDDVEVPAKKVKVNSS